MTALVLAMPAAAAANCTGWRLVGSDTFRGQDALLRSQGVTTDDRGWFFSWQGGLQRTLDAYTPLAAATLPPELALASRSTTTARRSTPRSGTCRTTA